jgi:hypothetical protein
MKNIILILLLATNFVGFSQELPTQPANGFTIPIGTKFTIMLHPVDSISFNYSIIEIEPYQEIVDTWENDSLFNSEGLKGTIEFYFCLSTSGKTDKEKKENMQVVLIMKNRTDYSLSYMSDIQTKEDGDFEETSNIGTFSGAKGIEMWPYIIYQIGLYDFKIMH